MNVDFGRLLYNDQRKCRCETCNYSSFMIEYISNISCPRGSDNVLPITFMALIDNESDKELFRQVYNTYRTMLLGYAYKITHNVSFAEDAVSEAFLRLAKSFYKIHNFDVAGIASYTVIIVRNVCFDMMKDEEVQVSYIDDIPNDDSNDFFDEAVNNKILASAVNDLPDIYRDVILLHYYYGMSINDVSEELSISFSCAKKRLSTALMLLRKGLRGNE